MSIIENLDNVKGKKSKSFRIPFLKLITVNVLVLILSSLFFYIGIIYIFRFNFFLVPFILPG